MVDKLACPPTSILADLIQGNVIDPELTELTRHLEKCAACQAKAKTLSPYDTLVEALRGEAPAADKIARDAPRPLVERIKQIPKRCGDADSDTIGLADAPADLSAGLDFLAAPQQPDEIGRLGQYRILKVLGKGGMGAVFLADDPKLERQVALKVILPNIAVKPTAKERFLREARAAAKLKSDYIVTIYQVDEANGVPYLAMELLEGMPLDELLESGKPLSMAQILRIGRDLAKGLAAAHDKGLIHRDIKPANLWLDKGNGGRVKILDFGLARAQQSDVHLTQSGDIVGTPAYMAPEQAHGKKPVDARADLFSLGCVLYRLCAGDIPFKGETTMGMLLSIATTEPTPPTKFNEKMPAALSELIMQLLQKDPAKRPATARDVVLRLQELEKNLTALKSGSAPDLAIPSRERERPEEQTASAASLGSLPARPLPAPRKRRGLLVAAACLLALLAGGAFTAYQLIFDTPNGRMIVQINDKDIEARFKNGKIELYDKDGKLIYTLEPDERNKDLPPGKYGIKIAGVDGLALNTDRFEMKRGDEVIVRVLFEPIVLAKDGKKPAAVAPAAAEADRKAAEWVLSVGGSVRVNDRVVDIDAVADLPAGPLRLQHVDLAKNAQADDAALACLADCRNLTGLHLQNTAVTDVGLAHLKDYKAMRALNLHGTEVTDDGLAHLKAWSDLLSLQLHSTKVTDTGLAHLKNCKGLLYLTLGGANATDTALAHLKGCKKLRELLLWRGTISAQCLADFTAAVPGCEIVINGSVLTAGRWPLTPSKADDIKRLLAAKAELTLRTGPASEVKVTKAEEVPAGPAAVVGIVFDGQSGVTDDDLLAVAARFTDLDSVVFGGASGRPNYAGVSPAGMSKLVSLEHLRHLNLYPLGVRAKGAAAILSSLPRLESIHLPVGIADEWARAVAARPSITKVNGYRTALTDAGLADLEKMPQLWSLNLVDTPLTPAAIERLAAAVPGSRIHWGLSGKARTIEPRVAIPGPASDIEKTLAAANWALGKGAAVIIRKGGKEVTVHRSHGRALRDFPAAPFAVVRIMLYTGGGYQPAEQIANADLVRLAALTDLEEVNLGGQPITAAGLAQLASLSKLKRLEILGTQVVAKDAAATIRGFSHLESLHADRSFVEHLEGMPSLRMFWFSTSSPTKQTLVRLKEYPNLVCVSLAGCNAITEELFVLKEIKNLRLLLLRRQTHSDDVLGRLAKEMPECEIRRWQGSGVWNAGRGAEAYALARVDGAAPGEFAVEPPPPAIAPFDARQARAHQRAWAQHLGVPVEFVTKQGMRFLLIPPGEFTMGASEEEAAAWKDLGPGYKQGGTMASPAHKVRLTRPVYLGEREVTLGEFRELMKRELDNKEQNPDDSTDGPVGKNCTWLDAIEFCNRLSERAGLKPAYAIAGETVTLIPGATGYRLPTEAEWEFACRAGTTTLWYYGMTAAEAVKDLSASGLRQRTLLGKPNPFGLLHMYAGATEWCWDLYHRDYYAECARRGVTIDPRGPSIGNGRVSRGGSSWASAGGDLSSINSAVRFLGMVHLTGLGRIVLPIEGALPLLKEQEVPPAIAPSAADILTSPDHEWTEPKDLEIVLARDRGHAVTADGLELWFARDEEFKSEGGSDLWVCRRKSLDAPWEAPVNVGPPINTAGFESQPVLSADGLTLLFHRYNIGGAYHMMEVNRADKNAAWSNPVSITGGGSCRTTALSADGLEAYTIDHGKLHRYTRPNRTARWANVGEVEDLPGRPVWFEPDGRWCLGLGDGKKLAEQTLWLAQRNAPGEPWAVEQVDLPKTFRGMLNPYPLLTPDGLELYFAWGNKLYVARRVLKAAASGRLYPNPLGMTFALVPRGKIPLGGGAALRIARVPIN